MVDSNSNKAFKATRGVASTDSAKSVWQEPITRLPPSVLEAFNGGWAATSSYGKGASKDQTSSSTVTARAKEWKIGKPGLPEINFVPYSWGTNRSGLKKGPSLLGHPISLSVVGPTLKNFNDWQWAVTDNSATPGVGDVFTLDVNEGILSVAGLVPPLAITIPNLYNITDVADYPGGLYITILQTGETGSKGGLSDAGLGDGFISDFASSGKNPVVATSSDSKYEIFRVTAVGATTFTLDSNKRLADYFTFPGSGTPYIRAVMFFQPHTTRLAALQTGSGKGSETAFVTLPPETVAAHDYLPSYNGTVGWLTGGFDPLDPTFTGAGAQYTDRPHTPILRSLGAPRKGRVQRAAGGPVPVVTSAGLMVALTVDVSPDNSMIGQMINIYNVGQTGTAAYSVDLERLLGWYEIYNVDIPGTRLYLKRVVEVDPATGQPFWGSSNLLTLDNSINDGDIQFDYTLHHTITSGLHTANYVDLDVIQNTRIRNLIDPSWANYSLKDSRASQSTWVSRAKPDKAIWDTTPNVNPGSLLDLGFRMVLFPAIEGAGAFAGTVQPDYANPITSNEVVLNPALSEAQSIDIDYASGVVSFSHVPVPGAGCTVAPNGIINTADNPRDEIVLFASCVPFSLEEGQLGSVSVGVNPPTAGETSNGGLSQNSSVFGSRVVLPVLYQVEGVDQTITSNTRILDLGRDADITQIPPSGFIEFRSGSEFGPPLFQGLSAYGIVEVVSFGDVGAGDKITINGVDLTAAAVPGVDEFLPTISNSTTATNIANAINNPANSFDTLYRASAEGAFVTIWVLTPGSAGNATTLAKTVAIPGCITVNGATFANGDDDTNLSVFGYNMVATQTDVFGGFTHPRLYGCWGGGNSGTYSTYTVARDGDVVAVLRKDITTPIDTDGGFGTDYAQDTTYGDAVRPKTIVFDNSTMEVGFDGSVLVKANGLQNEKLWEELFSSWVISGGQVSSVTGSLSAEVAETVILLRGRRYVVKNDTVTGLPASTTSYIYVDSTTGSPVFTSDLTLPLADPEHDILLAKVTTDLVEVISVVDLRNPLVDLDRRLDIVVGNVDNGIADPHFLTIADAVAYVGEIMTPTTGTRGAYLRIKVVGNTVETGTITMPCDGIVIEQVSPRRLGAGTDQTFIQWPSDAPLFDLNGKSDLIFNGLSVRHIGAGALGTPDRVMFTNTGAATSSDRVFITNCVLVGNTAHGFLYMDTAFGFADSLIENCQALTCSDFGIHIDTTPTSQVTIRGCKFEKSHAAENINSAGVRLKTGTNCRIENNYLSLFNMGVQLECTGCTVSDNTIKDTATYGFYAVSGSNNVVSGNNFSNIWTTAAVNDVGVVFDNPAADTVRGNFVGHGLANGTWIKVTGCGKPYANSMWTITYINANQFSVDGASWALWNDADVTGDVLEITFGIISADAGNVFDQNVIPAGNVWCTAFSKLTNNTMLGLVLASSALLSANKIGGAGAPVHHLGDNAVSSGNLFDAKTTLVRFGDACILSGNNIQAGVSINASVTNMVFSGNFVDAGFMVGAGGSIEESTMSGNVITGITAFVGNHSAIHGNRFKLGAVFTGNYNTIDGNTVGLAAETQSLTVANGANCVISNNRVDKDIDITTSPSTGCVLTGNICASIPGAKPANTLVSSNRVVGYFLPGPWVAGTVFGAALPVANDTNLA